MNARGIRAGRAFVELGTDNNRLEKGLRKAQARVNAFANNIASIGTKMMAIGGAITAPLLLAGRAFAKAGDDISKAAIRTGFAEETLSRLSFAAERSGASFQSLTKASFRLQRSIGEAATVGGRYAEMFEMMGLSVSDLLAMSPEEQFALVGDSLGRIEDTAVRAAIGAQIFGRGMIDLLPLLRSGRAGMQELFGEADRLGATWSKGAADSAVELTDRMTDMQTAMKAIVREVGGALAPILSQSATTMANLAVRVREFVANNQELVQTVFRAGVVIAGVGAGLLVLAASLKAGAVALGVMATAAKVASLALVGLKAAALLLASPLVLIAGVFALVGAAALQATGVAGQALEWLGNRFQSLASTAKEVFGGIKDALAAGDMMLAVQVFWAGLRLEFTKGLNWLKGVWRSASETIVDAFSEVRTRIATTFVDLFSQILNAWPGVVEGIVDIFLKAIYIMQDAWRKFRGLIDDAAVLLVTIGQPDIRDQLIMENIKRREDEAKQRQEDRKKQVAEIQATLALIKDDPDGVNADIERRAEQAKADRAAAAEEAANADQDRLKAAQDRFAAARKAAAQARVAAEETTEIDIPAMQALSIDLPDMGEIGEQVSRRIDIAGSFSAAAFDRLGIGSSGAEEQTAKNTAGIQKLMERQNRLIENGLGMEFD